MDIGAGEIGDLAATRGVADGGAMVPGGALTKGCSFTEGGRNKKHFCQRMVAADIEINY